MTFNTEYHTLNVVKKPITLSVIMVGVIVLNVNVSFFNI